MHETNDAVVSAANTKLDRNTNQSASQQVIYWTDSDRQVVAPTMTSSRVCNGADSVHSPSS